MSTETERPNVATAIARFLKAAGVKHAYGVPGEDHMTFLDALDAESITYVLARQEGAACIMAATEGQVTGIPGLAILSIATGLTNAINGIAHAYLDHLPMIIFSGQHARHRLPYVIRQNLDNHEIVKGVVKWSATLGEDVEHVLHKAMDIATSEPAGPVFLELSEEVALHPAVETDKRWSTWQPRGAAAAGPGLDAHQAQALLDASRKPVIMVGGDRYTEEERTALIRLAESRGALIFQSAGAKGFVPVDHPLLAGTFVGGELEKPLLHAADLLLTVNLSAAQFYNKPWPYKAPILGLNHGCDTEGFLPYELQLCGDFVPIAAALTAAEKRQAGWTKAEIKAYKDSVQAPFPPSSGQLTIADAVRRTQDKLPADAIVVADAGFSKPIIHMLWQTSVPDSYFMSHGLSTMGYALPAANALQILHPNRQVVAFMGDGSLLMRATEIGVAAASGTAPIYIAFMDGTMGQIAVKQERRELALVGAHFPLHSCAQIAKAFGGVGYDVETIDELDAVLAEGRQSTVPTLIGVRFDPSDRSRIFEALRG